MMFASAAAWRLRLKFSFRFPFDGAPAPTPCSDASNASSDVKTCGALITFAGALFRRPIGRFAGTGAALEAADALALPGGLNALVSGGIRPLTWKSTASGTAATSFTARRTAVAGDTLSSFVFVTLSLRCSGDGRRFGGVMERDE